MTNKNVEETIGCVKIASKKGKNREKKKYFTWKRHFQLKKIKKTHVRVDNNRILDLKLTKLSGC